jgi:ABC-type methionine transport system permease subunit
VYKDHLAGRHSMFTNLIIIVIIIVQNVHQLGDVWLNDTSQYQNDPYVH